MQRQISNSEPGNLVIVSPGSYLTMIEPGHENAALVLFQKPMIGVILDNISRVSDARVVQVRDTFCGAILAHEKHLKNIEE